MERTWRGRIRRLTRLSAGDLANLLHAQWMLVWAQWLVWTRPVGRLVSAVGRAPSAAGTSQAHARAARLALAIDRASEHGLFRPLCLVRAVALTRLLRARGLQGSRLRIGVQWRRDRFVAHAWVEYGNLVLADKEHHVKRFTPMTDVEVSSAP